MKMPRNNMKQLNKVTTKLLTKFLDRLGDAEEAEIQIENHPSLLIQRDRTIRMDEGVGFLFGIGTILDKKKSTYEHRMEFLVLDQRIKKGKKGKVIAYPVSFQDDINKVAEESSIVRDNRVVHFKPAYQKTHAKLAYTWLLDLQTAGYIK